MHRRARSGRGVEVRVWIGYCISVGVVRRKAAAVAFAPAEVCRVQGCVAVVYLCVCMEYAFVRVCVVDDDHTSLSLPVVEGAHGL